MLIIDQNSGINLITSSTSSISIQESSLTINTSGIAHIVANSSIINTISSSQIIAGPGTGLQKQLKTLILVNTDNINSNTIYLTYSYAQLTPQITLQAGECITYTGEQYRHYSATGSDITAGVIQGPQGNQGVIGPTGNTGSTGRNLQTGTTYTVLPSDANKIIALSNTSSRTITLCSASAISPGNMIWFSDEANMSSSYNITINTVGTDTINFGTNSLVLSSDGIVGQIYSDGIGVWYLVNDFDATEGSVLLNFGTQSYNWDTACVTVTCSWVNQNSVISLINQYTTTSDHSPDEILIEPIQLFYGNIVPGVSFQIMGYAENLTYGNYSIYYQKLS